MTKSVIDKFVDRGCSNWGTSKTYLVLFLALVGFGTFGSATIVFIPNEPDPEEPQNKTKSTKTKKENA